MSVILSLNNQNIFGTRDNKLAYKCAEDLRRFSAITKSIGNVVMGRKTFESLPTKSSLEDRINYVITNNTSFIKKVKYDKNVRR